VELLGTAVVGGIEFQDCVRVNIDDSTNSSQYWAGTGYFIVAAGVGVVEIEFNRSADGSQVRFLYMADQQFTAHTISGKVTVNGTPAVGKVVQIHNRSWGIRAITDGLGEFSLQAYGPDLFLRIGDDADNDGRLDFEADWPKEWKVEGIDKDTYVEVKF
jgi:acetamidase/formamidase